MGLLVNWRTSSHQTECLIRAVDDAFTIFAMLDRVLVFSFLTFVIRGVCVICVSSEMLGGWDTIVDPCRASNEVFDSSPG